MTTIKLKFRPSTLPQAEGTLYFQVIHHRTVKLFCTGQHIYASEWDEEESKILINSNNERLSLLRLIKTSLNWEMKQRQRIIAKLQIRSPKFTMENLCDAFSSLPHYITVFSFIQKQILKKEQMRRTGTSKTYANAYRRFREFRNNEDLTFEDLTSEMIEYYEAWLVNRGLMQNSIRFYLRTLNTLCQKAIDEGLLHNRDLFSKVPLSYVKTIKRAISESELRAICKLNLSCNAGLAFARDIFMFSFYMRGMSFVDIAFLKKSDLHHGLLEYCRKKTNQHLVIAWENAQQKIVNRYAHLTHDSPFMFPIIQHQDGTEYKQYHLVQDRINRNLKKIGDMIGLKLPLTLYVARHTWASVARNMNFPIAIISEGMGHHSYKTTQIYLDSINTSKINEANKKIMSRINR